MKKKYIGALFILLGIVIIAFPFLKARNENIRQQKILEAWNQMAAHMNDVESTKEQAEVRAGQIDMEDVIGILRIPAIELEQPVLKGAAGQNLSLSLAAVEPVGLGGEGNLVIAGHNSRTYGRHFNRLSELEMGDEITIETLERSYSYEVTGSFIVEAGAVWVLEETLDGAEITLITCYYPSEGETQRLIVKGIGI